MKELIITHTWDPTNNYKNGVCGHTYEIIDYMWKLKDYFDVKIIIPEIDIDFILKKYNFNDTEKELIKSKIIPRKNLIYTKGIVLITDGNLKNFKVLIKAGIIIQFLCGKNDSGKTDGKFNLTNKINENNLIFNLGDKRIYQNELIDYDYTKQILFERINKNNFFDVNYENMFYITSNCRFLNEDYFISIIKNYSNNIIFTDTFDYFNCLNDKYNLNLMVVNIKNPTNIFNYDFKNYVYTPVKRQWDCSSRLIQECKYFGINIDTSLIEYNDIALLTRIKDTPKRINLNNKIVRLIKEIENENNKIS